MKRVVIKKKRQKLTRTVSKASFSVHEELERRKSELKILEKMSKSFWATLDSQTISQHLFRLLHNHSPFHSLILMLKESDAHQLIVTSHHKVSESTSRALCQKVLNSHNRNAPKPLLMRNVKCVFNVVDTVKKGARVKSPAAQNVQLVPLKVLDKMHGFLGLSFSNKKASLIENSFINIVANELALILDYQYIQQRLVRERNLLSSILHSMTCAMLVVDERKRVILLNPMAEVVLGVKAANVIGRDVSEVVLDKNVCMLFDAVAIQASEFLSREIEMTRSSHERTMSVRANLAKVRNPAGQVVGAVMVLNDVTYERDIERARTEFVSVTSHELRTPMTAIREAVSLIIDGVTGTVNEKQLKFLEMARRNIDRLTAIINDLLDLSKIESGRLKLVREYVAPTAIAEEVFSTFDPVAHERGISLLKDFANGLPKIQVDQDKIAQVLNNLVSNAIKFTSKGGMVTLGARRGAQEKKFVEFFVRDTGIGIDRKDWGKLFQKFTQIDSALSRVAGGTGLGLAISKEIAEMHGGHIWFESEPGKGSQFHLVLPIRMGEGAARHKHVLLVTVNAEVEQAFQHAFDKSNFDLYRLTQGARVIDRIHERRPDLVVIDNQLSDMDGMALCQQLKGDSSTVLIPIILLTEAGSESKIWEALSLGVNGYLVGPIDKVDLLTAVREAIF